MRKKRYCHMKTSHGKLLLLSFIGVFAISIGFNILVIEKYGILSKLKTRVIGFFNSPEQLLSVPYSEEDNKPIVFFLVNDTVNRVSKSPMGDGKIIPTQLVIQPGRYDFLGNTYSLDKEGLYRFLLPGKVNAQRIVYKDDLDALLSAVSWIASHGNSDDQKTNTDLSNKALHSKLFITCGNISQWAQYILNDINVKSRLVVGMNIDDWNNYDNGHTLIEVWRERYHKWVLYDLDNNSYFIPSEGDVPLSLLEFSRSIISNNYRIVHLSSDTRLDVSNFNTSDGYSYGFFSEEVNVNIRHWYRRVMQVPLIFDQSEGKYLFMDKNNKQRIESYSSSYKYINEGDFNSRFYGGK